jgi:hypothetical protein
MDYEPNEEKLLFDKHHIKMIKTKEKTYKIEFEITNQLILLEPIIHFNLIKLIYEINKDTIFTDMNMELLSKNHATIYIRMFHFFADFGIKQKYIDIDSHISKSDKTVIFHATTIHSKKESCELLPLTSIIAVCNIVNPHKVAFTISFCFDEIFEASDIIEKMVVTLFCKIILRTKQCIEKMTFHI